MRRNGRATRPGKAIGSIYRMLRRKKSVSVYLRLLLLTARSCVAEYDAVQKLGALRRG
jgi:hypothetical protein